MKFSKYQNDIENEVRDGNGNVAVEATAGAGKTTTLLKCLNAIPKTRKSIFLSFSKAIVDELKKKVPAHVQARTLHSMGSGMIMNYFKGIKLDEDKYFKIAKDMFPYTHDSKKLKENFKFAYWVKDIVTFARMTLTPADAEELKKMCNYYSIDFTEDLISKAMKIISDIPNGKMTTMDFTDMIYLPVIMPKLVTVQYDCVLWDETQDCNNCQMEFIDLLKKKNGRLICVGDSKQAIYGFMGSTVDSFDKVKRKFNCKEFTLPISFRCPKQVVYLAQGVYDSIQFHEDAMEGEVRMGSYNEISEGDMVLCRNTLPLIYVYFKLIDMNIKATIVGKDIESGLVEFAKKIGGYSFVEMQKNMDRELEDLKSELRSIGFMKPEKHNKYINLVEKIQVISLILNKIEKPNQLIPKVHEIFSEHKEAARLMSIHRAKGLEANRVFILESFKGKQLMPSEYAVQEWEKIQEKNLLFVAYTRSKNEVILMEVNDEENRYI